jgi:hypothetical protein
VSFKGGHEWILESDASGWDLRYLHSPSYRYAVGPYWIQKAKKSRVGLQVSWLVHRGQWDQAQSNVYVWAGAGGASHSKAMKSAYPVGTQLDFETRRFYSAWMSEWVMRPGDRPQQKHKARAGFAPYLAGDGELNTWGILEVSTAEDPWWGESRGWKTEVTPLVRFYFKNVLWEMGISQFGNFKLNWMMHL